FCNDSPKSGERFMPINQSAYCLVCASLYKGISSFSSNKLLKPFCTLLLVSEFIHNRFIVLFFLAPVKAKVECKILEPSLSESQQLIMVFTSSLLNKDFINLK